MWQYGIDGTRDQGCWFREKNGLNSKLVILRTVSDLLIADSSDIFSVCISMHTYFMTKGNINHNTTNDQGDLEPTNVSG